MFEDLKGIRILVAEDDLALLEITKTLLKECGAVVHAAKDGREALNYLAANEVDLVISDIQMPEVDGLELLATLRAKDPVRPVVLFVTGQAQVDEPESLRLGAAGLMQKPVRMRELFRRIKDATRAS